MNPLEYDKLLTPGEVAAVFGVDQQTVRRWVRTGKLPAIRTPGGTRRYRASDVAALIAATDTRQDTP